MSLKSKTRKFLSFIRWRLIVFRYISRVINLRWRFSFREDFGRSASIEKIIEDGYIVADPIDEELIKNVQLKFLPRIENIIPKDSGHPFVNLIKDEDFEEFSAIIQIAFCPQILDFAAEYFNNKLLLDSIQVLYSYPTEGEFRESQYWHRDYGDSKSFHAIVYLNDVIDSHDGPFVFIDKVVSRKIKNYFYINRLSDAEIIDYGTANDIISFYGRAGEMVFVDPAKCYHYGSRCSKPRLALFVTFNSIHPFAEPTDLIKRNKKKLYELAINKRPDLSLRFFQTLLDVR